MSTTIDDCKKKGNCEKDNWKNTNLNDCCPLLLTRLFNSTGVDATLFPILFPSIRYTYLTSQAGSSYGIAGEASLPLVREITAEAFYNALTITNTASSNEIIVDIPKNSKNELPQTALKFGIDKNYVEVYKKRKEITNDNVYKSDQSMVKILAYLSYLQKNNNPSSPNDIDKIIKCLGLISYAKPILDTGALYAILEPTYNHNNTVGYSTTEIMERIKNINNLINKPSNELLTSYDFSRLDQTELPKNAVLETSDGAAASIAGRYFTVLSDTSAEIARHVPFMTVDKKLRYIMLIESLSETTKYNHIKQKMSIIRELIEGTQSNGSNDLKLKKTRLIIDLFYSILVDMANFGYDDSCIDDLPNINIISVIKIKKIYFDLFSVAKFLYLSRNEISQNESEPMETQIDDVPQAKRRRTYQPPQSTMQSTTSNNISGLDRMKHLLMSCSYDSQCHDNKFTPYYRLICVYYFIFFAGDELIDNFKQFTGIDVDSITIKDSLIISNLKNEFNKKYDSKDPSAKISERFPGIENYINLLLVNFSDKQQFIYYWLANKEWNEIEGMLQNWKHRLGDLVFSDGDNNYVHIVKPLLVDPNTGMIVLTDITAGMTSDLNATIGPSLIPWHSNISVDLITSWSTTLIQDIPAATEGTSELIFTAVTEIDAASSRMYTTATFLRNNVEIPLINYDGTSKAGFVFIPSGQKQSNVREVSIMTTNNPIFNSQITFLNNLSPGREEAKKLSDRFVKITEFLNTGNLQTIGTLKNECEKNILEKAKSIVNSNNTNNVSFFKIIKDLRISLATFSKKNNAVIKREFNGPIANAIDELKYFFEIKTPTPENDGIIKIDNSLYNTYFPYLNFVINSFADDKKYTNLTSKISDKIPRQIIAAPVEQTQLPAKVTGNTTTKAKVTGKRRLNQDGGSEDCEIKLSDIVGVYGIYMTSTEDGRLSSKPVNTIDDIYKLNKIYSEMYSIGQYNKNLVSGIDLFPQRRMGKGVTMNAPQQNTNILNPFANTMMTMDQLHQKQQSSMSNNETGSFVSSPLNTNSFNKSGFGKGGKTLRKNKHKLTKKQRKIGGRKSHKYRRANKRYTRYKK